MAKTDDTTRYTNIMTHTSPDEWEQLIQHVGVVVGCLIKQGDLYLLVEEKPDGELVWNLPAGHVDRDETLEDAATREAKEETGLDVRLIKQVGLYHESSTRSVKHVYSAEIIDGTIRPQPGEIVSVEWLSFEQIAQLYRDGRLRADWVWKAIRKDHRRSLTPSKNPAK